MLVLVFGDGQVPQFILLLDDFKKIFNYLVFLCGLGCSGFCDEWRFCVDCWKNRSGGHARGKKGEKREKYKRKLVVAVSLSVDNGVCMAYRGMCYGPVRRGQLRRDGVWEKKKGQVVG